MVRVKDKYGQQREEVVKLTQTYYSLNIHGRQTLKFQTDFFQVLQYSKTNWRDIKKVALMSSNFFHQHIQCLVRNTTISFTLYLLSLCESYRRKTTTSNSAPFLRIIIHYYDPLRYPLL